MQGRGVAQIHAATHIDASGDAGRQGRTSLDGDGVDTQHEGAGVITACLGGDEGISSALPPGVQLFVVVGDAQRQGLGGYPQDALHGHRAFEEGADIALEMFAEFFDVLIGPGRQAVERGESGQVVKGFGAAVGVIHPVGAHDRRQAVLRPLQFVAEGIHQGIECRRPW